MLLDSLEIEKGRKIIQPWGNENKYAISCISKYRVSNQKVQFPFLQNEKAFLKLIFWEEPNVANFEKKIFSWECNFGNYIKLQS